MDDLSARQPVRDELGAAFQPFLDQDRIVVGDGLVERQGRRDSVLVQHAKYPEYADAVAIFVVAISTDVWPGRLVTSPQAFRTAHRAHRQGRTWWYFPIPMLQIDDYRQRDASAAGPTQHWTGDNG